MIVKVLRYLRESLWGRGDIVGGKGSYKGRVFGMWGIDGFGYFLFLLFI